MTLTTPWAVMMVNSSWPKLFGIKLRFQGAQGFTYARSNSHFKQSIHTTGKVD